MSSSGSTTFPFDFDILAPSLMTMPWVRRFWNGSPPRESPRARGALVLERGERRGGAGRGRPPLAGDLAVAGEAARQPLRLLGNGPARRAVDDRDGGAPVALAADAPVAEAVVDLGLADPPPDQPLDRLPLGLGDREAVEEPGVDLDPVARVGLARPPLGALHGLDDREAVELGG